MRPVLLRMLACLVVPHTQLPFVLGHASPHRLAHDGHGHATGTASTCDSAPTSEITSEDLWLRLATQLGDFQRPATPPKDYAEFGGLAAVAHHFSSQGIGLSRQQRHTEAVAALERALEVFPAWSGHWNNAAVARLRSDGDGAESRLNGALSRDPANRLAGNNLLLARVVAAMRAAGSWGATTNVWPAAGPSWCRDDDTYVRQLTKGYHSTCAPAIAAAQTRSIDAGKIVCQACPGSCGLCPAAGYSTGSPPVATTLASALRRHHHERLSGLVDAPGGEPIAAPALPCEIERRDGRTLSPDEFQREYVAKRQPVMLTGLAADWTIQRWLQPQEQLGQAGSATETQRPSTPVQAPELERRAASYLRDGLFSADVLGRNVYLNLDRLPPSTGPGTTTTGASGGGVSLADLVQRELLPVLRAITAVGYTVPEVFGDDLLTRVCYRDLPYRWLLLSGAGTGSNWHVDPLNTSAWNTLLSGSKLWALHPPQDYPRQEQLQLDRRVGRGKGLEYFNRSTRWGREMGWWGTGCCQSPTGLASRTGTTAPWRDDSRPPHVVFAELLQQQRHKKHVPARGIRQCHQLPNETLYVPSGWWHATLNLSPSLALTQNFAASGNVEEVLAELDKRPTQTPEGGASATEHCARALRWALASEQVASAGQGNGLSNATSSSDDMTQSDGQPSTHHPLRRLISQYVREVTPAANNRDIAAATTTQASDRSGDEQLLGEATRFGDGAPTTHLLLFLPKGCDEGPGRRVSEAAAAIHAVLSELVLGVRANLTAAASAGTAPIERRAELQLVVVPPSQPYCSATPPSEGNDDSQLEKALDMPTASASSDSVRLVLVTASATLFKYAPPDAVQAALTAAMANGNESTQAQQQEQQQRLVVAVTEWVDSVASGAARPYLTAADREVLMRLYRK